MIRRSAPFLVFLILLLSPFTSKGQLTITVFDEQEQVIKNAHVRVLPDDLETITNDAGDATFETVSSGKKSIHVSILGYHTKVIDAEYTDHLDVEVQLVTSNFELGIVEIARDRTEAHNSSSVAYIDQDALLRNQQITLAASLDHEAGVQSINTGVGISKPVIRGLSSNRIAINQGGIRQEGQQWGQDHGLEVDVFDVDGIELIKGAAALQYGSDATGGVINLLPFKIPTYNTSLIEFRSMYNSNNQLLGSSILAASNTRNWILSARYSRQTYGDYKVPADSFTYNGFVLPLESGFLKNTAGNERNYRIGIARKHENGVTRISYSRYHLNAGFFSGAVGTPKAYLLEDDGQSRDIDIPYQEVIHDKLLFNHAQVLGKGEFLFDLGYQSNQRGEHSYPEFHNLPPQELNYTLGQFFKLETYSTRLQYQWAQNDSTKHTLGFSGQYQNNSIDGFDYLLPNFKTNRTGLYYLVSSSLKASWKWNAALRLDHGKNEVFENKRFLYNNSGQVLDSLIYQGLLRTYSNVSAAIGINKAWKNYIFRANASRSFRIPYPNETSSNGVHHGTFRHEQGNKDLVAETGYHLETVLEHSASHFNMEAALFGSLYQNFIYLSPSARFSPLPEAGQVYEYVQHNALFLGGEYSHQIDLGRNLSLYQSLEYVWNYNLNTGLALPFSPPLNILSDLEWNGWKRFQMGVSHQWTASQNRTDRNELKTPGYSLLHVFAKGALPFRYGGIEWQVRLQNLGNSTYLNHLSRYRILNLPEQGRNLSLSIRIPLSFIQASK